MADTRVPLLPRSQLLAISVYWLGTSATWGGCEILGQQRVESVVGLGNIANSISGPLALIIGGRVLDDVTRTSASMPRGVATVVGFLFLGAAVPALIPVKVGVELPGDRLLGASAAGAASS